MGHRIISHEDKTEVPRIWVGSQSVLSSSRATVARIIVRIGDEETEFTGEALVFPGDKETDADKFDPEIGQLLALGRALESAGRRLQRRGHGLVKTADHNRQMRIVQMENRKQTNFHKLRNRLAKSRKTTKTK